VDKCGISTVVVVVMTETLQAIVYPRLVKRFGLMRTYRFSTLFVGACATVMPFYSLLTGADMMLMVDGTTGWVSFVGALIAWVSVAGA
jgi:hypothetical protein